MEWEVLKVLLNQKENFMRTGNASLEKVYDALSSLKKISLSSLESDRTALVIVDMVNGFVKEGPLSSPNALAIQDGIERLLRACTEKEIPCIFFADTHTYESPEFGAYPVHCLAGDSQSLPTDELSRAGSFLLIPKNSTNGFLEPAFAQWLSEHPQVSTFLVVGCCTDICVQQFALSLKTGFNRENRISRVIVPMALSSTYDAPDHDSGFIDAVSFYNMQTNGVEVTPDIEF